MQYVLRAARRGLMPALAAAALAAVALDAPRAAPPDYPTEALADYVFGCMATNGQSREALRRCSCSIDAIAEKVPYEDYVQAETVLSMQQVQTGERTLMFRTAPWAQAMVDKLREAQVEAELSCF
jgi:predicted glycosyltransferase